MVAVTYSIIGVKRKQRGVFASRKQFNQFKRIEARLGRKVSKPFVRRIPVSSVIEFVI